MRAKMKELKSLTFRKAATHALLEAIDLSSLFLQQFVAHLYKAEPM